MSPDYRTNWKQHRQNLWLSSTQSLFHVVVIIIAVTTFIHSNFPILQEATKPLKLILTGKPGMLPSTGLQSWTQLNPWTELTIEDSLGTWKRKDQFNWWLTMQFREKIISPWFNNILIFSKLKCNFSHCDVSDIEVYFFKQHVLICLFLLSSPNSLQKKKMLLNWGISDTWQYHKTKEHKWILLVSSLVIYGDTLNSPSHKNTNFQNHSLVGGIIIMRTHPRVWPTWLHNSCLPLQHRRLELLYSPFFHVPETNDKPWVL